MIIGIDGKALLMQKSGIGIYTDRLLKSLLTISPELGCKLYLPFSLRHLLWQREEQGAYLEGLREDFPERTELMARFFPPPKLQRWLWSFSERFPVEGVLGEMDLYHATNLVLPPRRKAKGILTIYDLTFILFPGHHGRGMQALTRDIRTYIGRADCIIAISEQTKRDVVALLGVPAERVVVTLLAADERCRVIEDRALVERVVGRYGVGRPYILYTGTLEPRKNVPTLIRAFHALKQEMGIPHRLLLAGRKGWLYDEVFAVVKRLGLTEEVIFTGYVPDDDLPHLYNGADLFVYPSLYEGFGLPPLEAMACGCPVVTSNTSSLPEVVGNAGLMVDPTRVDDLAEAMGRILGDASLASDLRAKGVSRAAHFSWQRCAAETMAVYRQVTGLSG